MGQVDPAWGGKRKIWSVTLPARPPMLDRMPDTGGSVPENHSKVRKHLIRSAPSVFCGHGCPLPIPR